MKIYIFTFITIFTLVSTICNSQVTISEEIKKNIKARTENGINTGIVVGVITPDGVIYFSSGVKSLKTNEPVDHNSVFEIGSISKTFTGILLADMVIKNDLKLNTSVQTLLPLGVACPTYKSDSIKLINLSNHTSSLPRLPDNFRPSNDGNPYADYTEKQLYDFLNGYKLNRDIGSQYEYSNYAQGLLGYILASKKNISYEELLLEVITKPLGIENTRITLTSNMKNALALGHSEGIEVENWDIPTLAGAGAIRSTTVDMIKYLTANMGLEKSNLYPAMQLSHKNTFELDSNMSVGLGWHIKKLDGKEYVWHNGGTGGYRSFTGFSKDGNIGVVVLTNSTEGVDDIGFHLLNPIAILQNPKPSIAIKIKQNLEQEGAEKSIKTYWDLKKNQEKEFDFSEEKLNILGYYYLKIEDIKKAISIFELNTEAYPKSSNVYNSYAEALIKNNENEKAIINLKKSIELNPGNYESIRMLKEIGIDTDTLIKKVIVDEAILQKYVGLYELAPGFVLTISKKGSQLKAQATGQGENPIFPKSQNEFYLEMVEAVLTFNVNKAGEVQSVTLLQGGHEIIGKRLVESKN